MCTVVDYDAECSNTGDKTEFTKSSNYGYIKEKVGDNFVCTPLFKIAKDNIIKYQVSSTHEDKKAYEIQKVSMSTQISGGSKPAIGFTTTWTMNCNADTNGTFSAQADENGNIFLTVTDKSACGIELNKVILFVKNNKIISILFIILSLPLIFFGFKFIKQSLAVTGFLSGAVITAYVTTLITNFMTWGLKEKIIFTVVLLVVASLIATLCYHSPTFAVIAAGAALGYFGGSQLVNIYGSLLKTSMQDVYKGAVLAVCIGLGVVLGWKLKKVCIILATAFTGSYMLVFAVGSLIGNYPDVNVVIQKIHNQDFKHVDFYAWVYLASALVLSISGAITQFVKFSKKDETKDGYENQTNMKSDDFSGYY